MKTKMTKLLRIILTVTMILVLLTVAGCSSGNSSTENRGESSNGSGSQTSSIDNNSNDTGSVENVDYHEITIGSDQAAQNISPFTHFSNRQPAQAHLYEMLFTKDTNGELVPILAKSWTTEDNLNFDIELFDYIYDSAGNNIKAEDAVFSFKRCKAEAGNTWIDSVQVTGEYTFRLTCINTGVNTFYTAVTRTPIVSKSAYEASGDGMSTSTTNTSPYIVTEFIPNVSITLEKRSDYWQINEEYLSPFAKNSNVDKVTYIKIAEAAQQTIALETGTIDAFELISNTEVPNFQEGGRNVDNLTAYGRPRSSFYAWYYSMDDSSPVANDLNLRLAIAYAIDRQALADGALGRQALACNFFGSPEGMSDLNPTTTDGFSYNPELAKEYLAKSGYNGQKLRILVENQDNQNKLGAVIQGELLAIGIDSEILSYDNAMFQSCFYEPTTFDMSIVNMGTSDIVLVWNFFSRLSGGDTGIHGLADPELDALLEVVNTIDGHTVENATKVSDYINKNCYGLGLVTPVMYYIANDNTGIKDFPVYGFMGLRSASVVTY